MNIVVETKNHSNYLQVMEYYSRSIKDKYAENDFIHTAKVNINSQGKKHITAIIHLMSK